MLHVRHFQNADLWQADDLAQLDQAYPAQPILFSHGLAGHPLLDYASLARAAALLPASCIEWRKASEAQAFVPQRPSSEDLQALFARQGAVKSWLMLRGLENLPEYRTLIDDILAPVAHLSASKTGTLHQPRAFLFLSTAGAVTPFHFDPEHNILFHLQGPKSFHLFADKPPYVNDADQFRFHATGDNLLAPPNDVEAGGTAYALEAGQALYVPYKWPHMVQVGDAPSLSLSITWTSDWSLARDAAWRGAALLRRIGIPAQAMPDWPATAPVRSLIGKVAGHLL